MSIGREGAICEVIEIMQISPVRAMKAALIAASRGFCKLWPPFPPPIRHAGLSPAIALF